MLNTLSTLLFDPYGYVEIDVTPKTTAGDMSRRVNRVATLDGGAVVNDGGYTDADRTIDLEWQADVMIDAAVKRLIQMYTRIVVATRDGVFLTAPETYRPAAGASSLRLLAISKLSA